MKARIVYESIFGNTRAIAEAIASGLSDGFETETVEVGACPPDTSGIDLVVVGGPTHVLAMSRPSTRAAGKQQAAKLGAPPVSEGIGIREWLDGLDNGHGTMAAAFDTGMGRLGIFPAGSAARGEANQLTRRGYRVIDRPQQFLVATEGDRTFLKAGELDRAVQWGQNLARLAHG
jgi:hypothetical protein